MIRFNKIRATWASIKLTNPRPEHRLARLASPLHKYTNVSVTLTLVSVSPA